MRLYFLGISGSAMGQVALLCKRLGHSVAGSDTAIYPPMSDLLREAHIEVSTDITLADIQKFNPDLVVVGNIISRGHEQIEWLLETKAYAYCSMPELLRSHVLHRRPSIVVSGTHGKTTTTAAIAYLLTQLNKNPGYLMGGVPRNLPSGATIGDASAPFVIEGDEYDTAFFDKRSKFIHYNPHILLINNMEFDHADIFRDFTDVQRTFSHVVRLVPRNGYIIVNGDDPAIKTLIEKVTWAPIIRVGKEESNDLQIKHFFETTHSSSFELWYKGQLWGKIEWSLHGFFNARNAAMAVMASSMAIAPQNPLQINVTVLNTFQGVKRRQEVVWQNESSMVIEDFGHHPTAIAHTLSTLQSRYPQAFIVAAFEPRSNSMCRRVFQEKLVHALSQADAVFLAPVHRPELLKAEERLNLEEMCQQLKQNQDSTCRIAQHFSSNPALQEALEAWMLQQKWPMQDERALPIIFIFFSNGSFGGVIHAFAKFLQKNSASEFVNSSL